MTREEAIKELERAFDVLDHSCHMDNRRKEAFDMARVALSAEPCEDAISFPKGTLKKRGKGYVVYDVKWLKKNWQTELKVMGVECEDAISREQAIKECYSIHIDGETFDVVQVETLMGLPSVTPKQKMGHWEHHIILGVEDVPSCSKCGMCQPKYCETNYCPNCGAKMAESEDKESE